MSGHRFSSGEWLLTFSDMENKFDLSIVKCEPLTFECTTCNHQFDTSGKSLQQIDDEVSEHIRGNHPELLHSEPPEKAA